jgi:hypothetical protein
MPAPYTPPPSIKEHLVNLRFGGVPAYDTFYDTGSPFSGRFLRFLRLQNFDPGNLGLTIKP